MSNLCGFVLHLLRFCLATIRGFVLFGAMASVVALFYLWGITMANAKLSEAKNAKNDEFYTQYEDIQREINAYLEYDPDVFRGKTVLLPCDDPEWSNFTRFFAQNFENFGLKKLISTSYAFESKHLTSLGYQLSFFEEQSPQFDADKTKTHGKIFTLTRDSNQSGVIDIDDLEWRYLEGDGDFRSDEVKTLRDEADIIVTNPPFSLFREFLAWIVEAKKDFVVIGSMNAITYKEIFPLIKDNKMWLGNGFNGGNAYFEPFGMSTEGYATGVYDKKTGLVKFRNCCWFTNLEHGRRHQPLQLMTMADNLKFSRHKEIKENGYQKYDNYDAIEIPFTDAIPSDYDGVMGVPISFLEKYCPEQFEIKGQLNVGCFMDENGWQGSNGKNMLAVGDKTAYKRILIKKKVSP